MARELKGGQPRYAAGGGATSGVSLIDPPARTPAHGAPVPAKDAPRPRTSGPASPASGQAGHSSGAFRSDGGSHAERFGIDDSNLATRRDFIRLGELERSLLAELIPWARSVAAEVAKEFYNWQFEFGPTRRFFENHAQSARMPLSQLRQALERAQAGYFTQIFEGAEENWGPAYFERRLKVGSIHDKINLPFKWYIGSYSEYQRLTGLYLRKAFKDADKIAAAEQAIFKVFNYDIQAVSEAFLMNTFESVGLSLDNIQAAPGADRTEHVDQIKDAIGVLLQQATVLSEDQLRDPVLDRQIPGPLGDLLFRLSENLRRIASQADALAAGDLDHSVFQDADRGTQDRVLEGSIAQVRENVQDLGGELARLTAVSRDGQLSERGKLEQFQGAYAGIVAGVNEMLDAILLPIGEGNRILAQISSGKIDEMIAQTYKGDHEKMKQAVNNVAVVLQGSAEGVGAPDRGLPRRAALRARQGRAVPGRLRRHRRKASTKCSTPSCCPSAKAIAMLGLIRGGNLREKVEIACKGDHEKMKNAINGVHDWLTDLVAYVTKIANGDMTRRDGQGFRARTRFTSGWCC